LGLVDVRRLEVGQALVTLLGQQVATPTHVGLELVRLYECLVHGTDCVRGVRDIELEWRHPGLLSLKHLAEFSAEEAHMLRVLDLRHTSRSGAANKRNRVDKRKRQLGLDFPIVLGVDSDQDTDVGGRDE